MGHFHICDVLPIEIKKNQVKFCIFFLIYVLPNSIAKWSSVKYEYVRHEFESCLAF